MQGSFLSQLSIFAETTEFRVSLQWRDSYADSAFTNVPIKQLALAQAATHDRHILIVRHGSDNALSRVPELARHRQRYGCYP